jgi:uncharacterized coiled-coil DUF342 family protein
MNLAEIDNMAQLKAMAYDQLVALEQVQNELRAINTRIAELQIQEAQLNSQQRSPTNDRVGVKAVRR